MHFTKWLVIKLFSKKENFKKSNDIILPSSLKAHMKSSKILGKSGIKLCL